MVFFLFLWGPGAPKIVHREVLSHQFGGLSHQMRLMDLQQQKKNLKFFSTFKIILKCVKNDFKAKIFFFWCLGFSYHLVGAIFELGFFCKSANQKIKVAFFEWIYLVVMGPQC